MTQISIFKNLKTTKVKFEMHNDSKSLRSLDIYIYRYSHFLYI